MVSASDRVIYTPGNKPMDRFSKYREAVAAARSGDYK